MSSGFVMSILLSALTLAGNEAPRKATPWTR
jgi:hypothetical protein